MLKLETNEFKDLRALACLDRSTKEIDRYATDLTETLLTEAFREREAKCEIHKVGIPKRILIKLAEESHCWSPSDTLGIKLREELERRTKKLS